MAVKKKAKKVRCLIVTKPVQGPLAALPPGYVELLENLKDRIRRAQVRAAAAASRELVQLYWDIGREIVHRQEQDGWGKGVVDRLVADIQRTFPGIAGFSARNVRRMRAFYLAYSPEVANWPPVAAELDNPNLPQAAAEIPWFHNVVLLEKLKRPAERLWYAEKVVQHGWSRAVLVHQIELDLYEREGRAITNFSETLPPVQSDLAQQVLKDPYVFDFLTLADDQPSIGIILCKARNRVTVEYALRDTRKPIGVSKYRLTSALPKELKSSLPTIKQLEKELKAASFKS